MNHQQLSSVQHRELLRQFIMAWHHSIEQQQRLLPALAQSLSMETEDIFYGWARPPHCSQHGFIRGTRWTYVFHGFADCDLKNELDGRFLQVSFGPRGRFDVFSAWGTLQYVMASKYPWPDYRVLKLYLAEQRPPYNHLSGSYSRMRMLISPLRALGLFEAVDRELLRLKAELSALHTRTDDEGRRIYEPPDPFNNPEEKIFWDLEVAHAQKLTPLGKKLLHNGLDEDEFAELWAVKIPQPLTLLETP